MLESKLGLK